jgi:hypothetical protein
MIGIGKTKLKMTTFTLLFLIKLKLKTKNTYETAIKGHKIHTGVGQNNENTAHTIQIWCWTTSAFNTAAIVGMDSHKFSTVSSGISYYSSGRISLNFFRDIGGWNLSLTLVSKTDWSGSMMFKSRDCAGQGRC